MRTSTIPACLGPEFDGTHPTAEECRAEPWMAPVRCVDCGRRTCPRWRLLDGGDCEFCRECGARLASDAGRCGR